MKEQEEEEISVYIKENLKGLTNTHICEINFDDEEQEITVLVSGIDNIEYYNEAEEVHIDEKFQEYLEDEEIDVDDLSENEIFEIKEEIKNELDCRDWECLQATAWENAFGDDIDVLDWLKTVGFRCVFIGEKNDFYFSYTISYDELTTSKIRSIQRTKTIDNLLINL